MVCRSLFAAGLIFGLPVFVGCEDSSLVTVHGNFTVNGRQLERGSIRFQPCDGRGMTVGGPITAGRYEIEMAAGPKRVEIRSSRAGDEQMLYPEGPSVQKMEEQIPSTYHRDSNLRVDVNAEEPLHDFALELEE